MKKRKILVSLLAVVMTAAVAMFAFSCKKQSETPKDYGEAGLYYCEAVNGDEYALSLAGSKIAMTTTEETVAGTYSYDGKTFKVTFAGESASEGKLEDNVLTITYKGSTYTFYKNVKYTASFSVDGTVKETAKVTNGKKLVKPADPQKADNNFVGWYSNAEYTAPYDFNLPVMGDVTLYARFAPATPGESEFNAKLMADDKVYENVKTIGGVIYHLPVLEAKAGKEFSGWYVSDYQSAEKLTYKYDGRKLAADTTLYAVWKSAAPEVTISESGKVVWTVKGGVTGYAVKVYQGKNEEPVHTQNDVSGEVSYNFANAEAGDYKITVSDGSNETAVYYKNKVLARVSQFEVVEPGVLVWNEVAGADKYLVTVNCGTEGHTHKDFDNGKSTNYNFANCDMKQGGITFEVKAVAAGRATSVSEAFVYNRELEKVTGLQIKNDVAYWNKVAGAASYVVTVKKVGEDEVTENVGNSTSYSLKDYTGSVSVSVVPVTKGYNSPEAASAVYTKTTLSAPAGVKVVGNKIVWEEVADAKGYVVKIGSAVKNITGGNVTECEITDADVENVSEIKVTVQALANNTANNSAESDEVVTAVGKMSSAPVYAAGVVSWGSVLGASKYEVTVNNGKINAITDGSTTFNANLDKAGNNEIVVKAFKDGAKEGEYVYVCEGKVTVKAYTVTIDVRGGTDVEKQYVAYGDELTIPSTKYYGYDFKGWYNLPGGAADNGKLFENGATYDYASNMILYAYWEPAVVDVIFDTMGIGSMKADDLEENEIGQLVYKVTFGKSYKLPVPDVSTIVISTSFGGWYTEAYGEGDRYTNELGVGYGNWDDAKEMRLYATWRETLTYTKVYNQDTGGQGYSVTQGPDIGTVTTVKVPAKYTDGLPITTIEADAFYWCSNLIEVQIPDSIQNIETGYITSDGEEISSAFSKCSKLEKVTIYEVEGNHDKLWSSRGGVLFYNNVTGNNGVEMRYVPAALKPGTEEGAILTEYKDEKGVTCTQFTIPDNVTTLPLNAFNGASFTKIIVPYSVTKIDAKAFYSAKAKQILFEKTPEGKTEQELVITATNAFSSCAAETIILPTRLAKIDFPAIFGGCKNLKNVGFVGEGGSYEAVSLNDKIKYALDSDNDGVLEEIPFGVVVDKSNAAKKVLVFSPVAYEVSAANGVFEVPANIAVIGPSAFVGTKFKGVKIGENVEEIGENAFKSCTTLESITIENGEGEPTPLTIKANAFNGCKNASITKIVIPARTVSIEASAFYSTAFSELVFEGDEAVLDIGEEAFGRNSALTTVTFGASVKHVATAAFYSCSKLKTIVFDCGPDVVFDECAFGSASNSAYSGNVTSVTIGKDMAFIKLGAVVGANVTSIAIDKANVNYKMEGGTESYVIKETVTGEDGVVTETGKTVTVNALPEGVTAEKTYVNGGIVYSGDGKVFALYPASLTSTDLTISDTVEEIVSFVLYNNKKITGTLTIGSGVKVIGNGAFRSGKYSKIIIKETGSDMTIGDWAFANITTQAITIPGRVKTINEKAFCSTQLTKITLEEGVETLGVGAISSNSKLADVSLPASIKNMGTYVSTDQGVSLGGVFDAVEANAASGLKLTIAEGGNYFASQNNMIYTVKNGVKDVLIYVPKNLNGEAIVSHTISKIEDKAFYGKAKITKISFDGDLIEGNSLEIGADTFSGCSVLASVVLPNGVTKIGEYAFKNCSKLAEITIPKTVNYIGGGAFLKNTALATVTFAGVDEAVKETLVIDEVWKTQYGNTYIVSDCGAFQGTSITSITLPNRPVSIGAYAFKGCTALTTVTFKSNSVEKIGKYAFAENPELVSLPGFENVNTLKSMPEYMFYNDAKLAQAIIPAGVEEVGGSAFKGCSSITSATIPATVKVLGTDSGSYQSSYVFCDCASLASVTFEDGIQLENLWSSIFDGCSSLESLTLPEGIKYIGAYIIRGSAVKSIKVPASVEELYNYAFASAGELTSVTFAEGSQIRNIGMNAFEKSGLTSFSFPETDGVIEIATGRKAGIFNACQNLTDLHLSSSIKSLGDMLVGCTSIKHITVAKESVNFKTNETNSILYNYNETAIKYICGLLDEETVTIADGIKTIGERAFANQWKVKKFIIPESVKDIGDNAFENCISLKEIEFKKNGLITSIGSGVFKGCKKLTKLTLPEGLKTIGSGVLGNGSGNCFVQEIYIPDSVTSIPSSAFQNATSLTKVTGMKNVVSIGIRAFYGTSVSSIDVSENCTSIGDSAFANNKALVAVTGMKNVATLGKNVFQDCISLREVALNDKIKVLPNFTFDGCTSLISVSGTESLETIGESAFEDTAALSVVSLPSVTEVQKSAFSGSGITEIELPALKKIDDFVFNDCTKLATVSINDAIEKLGTCTFRNCSSLSTVKLPSGLKALPDRLFEGSGITSIKIPDSITSISDSQSTSMSSTIWGMFAGCVNLETVNLNNVEKIGKYAFYNCVSLKSIDLSNVEIINQYAFSGSGIESVDLANINTVGDYAFEKCLALTSVNNLKTSAPYMFSGCSALESVDLSGVADLMNNSFSNCVSLSAITFGSKISTIPQNAFSGCSALESVSIPESVSTIEASAFTKCTALSSITLNEGVKNIGDYAFNGGCYTTINIPKSVDFIGTGAFNSPVLASYNVNSENKTYKSVNGILYSAGAIVAYPVNGAVSEDGTVVLSSPNVGYSFSGNKTVKKVVITGSYTEIPDYAFYNSSVEEVEISGSVISIGSYAFANSNISKFTINLGDGEGAKSSLATIGDSAFLDCAQLTSFEIPVSVESVGLYAFAGSGLTSIVIPENEVTNTAPVLTTSYGSSSVFKNCKNLASVTLPDSLKVIGDEMFMNCESLKTITLPAALETIEQRAFKGSGLTSIVMPKGITKLLDGTYGSQAETFMDCKELTSVEFLGAVENIGEKVFENCVKLESVKFAGSENKADGTIVFPKTLTKLYDRAFFNTAIKGVVIHDKFTEVGYMYRQSYSENNKYYDCYGVFANCAQLKYVEYNAKTITGGVEAFRNCTALETVKFGSSAIDLCSSGTNKTLLMGYMFAGCTSLRKVDLGGVKALSSNMFNNCTALEEITIPKTLTYINSGSFENSGITTVNFEEGRTSNIYFTQLSASGSTSTNVFKNCLNLTSFVFPEKTSFGSKVAASSTGNIFEGCVNLTSVEFKNDMTVLPEKIFLGCEKLTTLKFVTTPENATGLYIPEGIAVGKNAFDGVGEGATITFETNYYYTIGVWNDAWYAGCKATIVMDGITMNPYLF